MTEANRSAIDARAWAEREMLEAALYERIRGFAVNRAWLLYHTYRSQRSFPGFPDVALCLPPLLLMPELKRMGKRPTREQQAWIDGLNGCTIVRSGVWRPSDLDRIEAVLQAPDGLAAARLLEGW